MKSSILVLLLFFVVNNIFAFTNEIDTINYKVLSESHNLDVYILKKRNIIKSPVVIFLVGSGGIASHKTNYNDFVKFFLEDNLLPEDFSIVYFDKRGVGNSEGKWYKTSFEQRALDAKNVAISLREFDFIDTSKVFIVGHSQGAWITQIVLAEYPDIFLGGICMAGATFGVKKQIINDYMNEYICEKGYSEEATLKKAKCKTSINYFFISILGKLGLNNNWTQLDIIKSFEPHSFLKRINNELLLMFAENDMLVSLEWCLEDLNKIFKQDLPKNIEIYVANGENHSFKIAPKCYKGNWNDIQYSMNSQQKIKEWLVNKIEN